MKVTAYVSHWHCPRHDTGWSHADHQGRIPAVVRAVYKDMLTLHEPLQEVEAVPATVDDLLLVHTARHVRAVREAAEDAQRSGQVGEVDGVRLSGASWEAALAAAGSALTGVEAVLGGEVRNAFCAARPPGRGAWEDEAGENSLFHNVAIAARHLRERRGVARVLVVDWGVRPPLATAALLADDPGVALVSVHQHPESFPPTGAPATEAQVAPPRWRALAPGSGGQAFGAAMEAALGGVAAHGGADFVLLSLGLDVLAHDPTGALTVEPAEVHGLTRQLCDWAGAHCQGRVVSVLEGGYGTGLGPAVVQHLRAMAGLPAA